MTEPFSFKSGLSFDDADAGPPLDEAVLDSAEKRAALKGKAAKQLPPLEGGPPSWFSNLPAKYQRFGPSFLLNAECASMSAWDYLPVLCSNPTHFRFLDGKTPEGKLVVRSWPFIPGHSHIGPYGPRPSRVMVISKFPGGREEIEARRNFVGPSGRLWKQEAASLGLDFNEWYITNVCKFRPEVTSDKMPVAHLVECMPLLYYELSIVRPEIIVCMGADAMKALFGDKATLRTYRGSVTDFQWRRHDDPDNPVEWSARVVCTTHPANVERHPEEFPAFKEEMALVAKTVRGDSTTAAADTHYQVIDNFEDLDVLVTRLIGENRLAFSVDCEWSGSHPSLDPSTNYLRSIQIAWDVGHAAYFKCTDEEGRKFLLAKGKYTLGQHLRPLFFRPGVRLIAHSMRADLPWLYDLGLSGEEMERIILDGHDTILSHHILDETADHGLDAVALSCTPFGRYDLELNQWIAQHLTTEQLEEGGFRRIPDRVLIPYALIDADATFRIFLKHERLLIEAHNERVQQPVFTRDDGQPCTLFTLFRDIEHRAIMPLLEMETNGFRADRDRMIHLTQIYNEAGDILINKLRRRLNWPTFNPRSTDQMRALLFPKVSYKGKKAGIAPEDAKRFDFQPLKNTGKGHGTAWEKIRGRGEELLHAPSADSDTVGTLLARNDDPDLKLLRNFKIVDQVCKNFLPLPAFDKATGQSIYRKGLISCIRPDNAIHTTLSALAETGRHRSSDPNMQNIPKKQEKQLRKILIECGFDPKLLYSIRSCFMANPGEFLVSADYSGAELVVMAVYSGDKKMMAILWDPRRDLHLETANEMFSLGLNLDPDKVTPEALEKLKKEHEADRVKAKAVNFGIPYGLGAYGLKSDLEAEGVTVSLEECEEYLAAHQRTYPQLHVFLAYAANTVYNPGFFETVWGRRRRFHAGDEEAMSHQERQAKNFPIQSVVADSLNLALVRLWEYKRRHPEARYSLILPVHDEINTSVHPSYLRSYMGLLPRLMEVPVPGFGCSLKVSVEVTTRWGSKPTLEEAKSLGLSDADIKEFLHLAA